MLQLPTKSPFFRFAVVVPLVVASIVAALFLPLFWEAEHLLRGAVLAAVRQEMNGLEEHFHEQGSSGLQRVLQARVANPIDPDAVYLLVARDGRVLAGNLPGWPAGAPTQDDSVFRVRLADGANVEGQVFELFGGERLLVGRRSPLEHFRRNMVGRLWLSALLIVLACSTLVWLFLRWLRRRLRRMAEEAAHIQAGHLAQRLSLSAAGDELDELSTRFNLAFDEIERLVDAAKHISSAIAHDMRRPLTELHNALEETLAHTQERSPLNSELKKLRGQTGQLLQTFSALLSLARLEAGALGPRRQPVELAALVEDACDLYAPLVEAGGHAIRVSGPAIAVQGDRDLLFQLLVNLLDNAVRHGRGGDVLVATHLADGAACLSVRDHGPGVPAADLDRLCERFYRGDASRSRADGAGIGLSLVQAIAQAHGGRVVLRNAEPGLAVEVCLPLGEMPSGEA